MIKIELEKNSSDQQEVTTNATSKQIHSFLPYAGKPGNNIIWKMRRQLNEHLNDDVKVMIRIKELNFRQGFKSKIKRNLNIEMT